MSGICEELARYLCFAAGEVCVGVGVDCATYRERNNLLSLFHSDKPYDSKDAIALPVYASVIAVVAILIRIIPQKGRHSSQRIDSMTTEI
ncbi:hypothetical protein AG1IA_05856 [Rhizoctonia solani AG-1 IA]|uniref:Uncharacterized protein n=1 Tax=Thanatephorus cucumeris (strain AG1-IA) TaxID=983506 RepID=L8WQ25_THACA|nr:hypothetical protein AG1IA_05856 [Rhizoctonia solani AG-1 IA]